ncbi:hypothetical protein BY458DRAFT_461023 [Sporodiniella umbellata]|nr:hypothetical protein BY458DRAFT_461023 [Sporodiniella umbellata]
MSNYSRDTHLKESSRSPPAIMPGYLDTSRDSNEHTMKKIPIDSPQDPYYRSYSRESMSDNRFMGRYDSYSDTEKFIPKERRKRSCVDKMCCGCCVCCPKWMRWCTCILFIIVVIIAIVVGVLVALFKVPTVSFSGLQQAPTNSHTGDILNMTFSLGISVNNPNFESITFEKIMADAYYPSPYNVKIGGGGIENVHIVSNGITNITFPFSVAINSTDSAQQGVLMDLLTKCGLDGSTKQDIRFNYYVYPTVRVAGIPITPTISKSMTIACPLKGDDLTPLLG